MNCFLFDMDNLVPTGGGFEGGEGNSEEGDGEEGDGEEFFPEIRPGQSGPGDGDSGHTAVEKTQSVNIHSVKTMKIFHNGNILIKKNGEIFTATGSKVK